MRPRLDGIGLQGRGAVAAAVAVDVEDVDEHIALAAAEVVKAIGNRSRGRLVDEDVVFLLLL
eukprot:10716474-Heterocapsa_arctica.AAC.1